MPLFDIVLIGIIVGFTLFGFWFGFIHTLGSLVGTLLATYLASRWYEAAANWLMNITGWTGNFPKVLMFIILFLIINRLVGLLFFLVDRSLSIITKMPFINSLNKLIGGVFGFIEGLVVLGITIYFINKFPLGPGFMTALANSKVAPYCVHASSVLLPFVPEAIKQLKAALNL